jgi:hypothetical protein
MPLIFFSAKGCALSRQESVGEEERKSEHVKPLNEIQLV